MKGNQVLVNAWIYNPKGMQGRCSAFDFPLKFVLNAMCNHPGRFNMSDLDHVGLAGTSPEKARHICRKPRHRSLSQRPDRLQ